MGYYCDVADYNWANGLELLTANLSFTPLARSAYTKQTRRCVSALKVIVGELISYSWWNDCQIPIRGLACWPTSWTRSRSSTPCRCRSYCQLHEYCWLLRALVLWWLWCLWLSWLLSWSLNYNICITSLFGLFVYWHAIIISMIIRCRPTLCSCCAPSAPWRIIIMIIVIIRQRINITMEIIMIIVAYAILTTISYHVIL